MSVRRRVLLDENLPTDLRRWLPSVEAISAEYMGWKGFRNGELCRLAQAEGFNVLVTADRLLAQAYNAWSLMGCGYVTSNRFPVLWPAVDRIDAACQEVLPGKLFKVSL